MSLIYSGSAQKYLLYAAGEVLLVMIGIVLALPVNNWLVARKESSKELILLKTLELDLAENTKSTMAFITKEINKLENK